MQTIFKTTWLFLSILLLIVFSCESSINKDYVELSIPPELENHPEAVAYLQEDADQLNKMFNTLDEFLSEVESFAILAAEIDTNNIEATIEYKSKLEHKAEKLSNSMLRFQLNLMWYLGKEFATNQEDIQGIIKRLDTQEGVVFQKSLNHLKVKKELLKKRAELFAKRIESISIPDSELNND